MSISKPVLLALFGSLCAPLAARSDPAAIEVCMDYVMQICGPETPPGMTLLNAFDIDRATRVSLRDGAGEIWQCSGRPDGLVDDVEMTEFAVPRAVPLAAETPSVVLQDTLAASGTAHYVVTLAAGQNLFAHVVEQSAGIILEVRDPDGVPLPLRTVTDHTFLGTAGVAGEYAVRLINHGMEAASLRAIISAY